MKHSIHWHPLSKVKTWCFVHRHSLGIGSQAEGECLNDEEIDEMLREADVSYEEEHQHEHFLRIRIGCVAFSWGQDHQVLWFVNCFALLCLVSSDLNLSVVLLVFESKLGLRRPKTWRRNLSLPTLRPFWRNRRRSCSCRKESSVDVCECAPIAKLTGVA